jgi:flagellin
VDSVNIAYVGTHLDTVDTGAKEVSRILDQMQTLATLVNTGGLTQSAREQVHAQFQALRASINNVPPQPPGSQYDGKSLLDSVGAAAPEGQNLVIGGFTDTALLGSSEQTDISTPEGASQASQTIAQASQTIANQRATIQTLQASIDFAAVSVDGALQNQDAARSTLSESDLNGIATASLQAGLQANTDAAKALQTNRLPDSVLALLS